MQLVSKISNLCDHNPPTSQTEGLMFPLKGTLAICE